MNSDDIIDLQQQIRDNADDLQKYLLDLNNWEKEMKQKEEELKNVQTAFEQDIPPIRNTFVRSKKKSRHKKSKEKHNTQKKRIPSYDYKSWEKFDVDAELKNIDKKPSSASSDNSEDEENEHLQRKQLAIVHKDKGNECFKKNNFDAAITCYTNGMELDPENPLLPANRAMAFIKKEQFQAAENDCTLSLSFDPTYVKAYLRRATARAKLNKVSLAIEDFSKVLELEPENKEAIAQLAKLKDSKNQHQPETIKENSKSQEGVVNMQTFWPKFLGQNYEQHNESPPSSESKIDQNYPDSCIISPIQKPVEQRSKKPFVQIKIKDVYKIDESSAKESNSTIKTQETSVNPELNSTTVAEAITINELEKLKELSEKWSSNFPPVPTTSFQFLSEWKKNKKNKDFMYRYLKQFPAENFPLVFKHSMDAELFTSILHILSTSFLENGDDVLDYLKFITKVGRFNTLLMFLSESECKDLTNLLDSIKDPERQIELCELKKCYKL